MEANKDIILIIEDDDGLIELLKEILEESGNKVVCVQTAKNAFNWLKEHTPFLMILDYSLPDMSGREFITKLKTLEPTLPPFIVSTGQGDERIAVEMMKLGARDYIIKDRNFLEMLPLVINKVGKEIENQNNLKLAEQALKESEEKHRAMIANISDVIAIVDQNGINRYKSPNIEKLFGWKPEDLVGINTLDKVHPNDLERVKKILDKVQDNPNATNNLELRFQCKENNFKWIELTATNRILDPAINGVLLNYHDITERKHAEKELKQSEEKFRKAFSTSPDSININRIEDGMYISVNKGFTQIMGYSEEEILGKSSLDLNIWKNPKDREKLIQGLKAKGFVENLEAEFCSKSGESRFGLMSANIIELEGKPYILNITRDITERKQVEIILQKKKEEIEAQNQEYLNLNEELKQTNAELFVAKEKAEESDKLKTAFLNNISHEIRTPMNAIIGFSQFLAGDTECSNKRGKFAQLIQTGCNQLLDIVTNVIDISQIQANQTKIAESEISLYTVFDEVYNQFEQQAKDKNVEFIFNIYLKPNQFQTITDGYKLTKILNHLINNALKFTSTGFIKMECRITDKNEYEFDIIDCGIGIEEEMQRKIFEPFRQVEIGAARKFGGTGVGLTIAKAFIEMLGGKIWMKSEINQGTTISFSIPYKPVEIELQPNHYNLTELNLANKVILIAEDEFSNYLLLEELLSLSKIKILHAVNGIEAVDYCRNMAKIDMILMDIKMPIMDGHTAAKRIKEFRPDIPIIAQSAYALEHEKEKYHDTVFDDFIAKPIKSDELKQKVMKYINQIL